MIDRGSTVCVCVCAYNTEQFSAALLRAENVKQLYCTNVCSLMLDQWGLKHAGAFVLWCIVIKLRAFIVQIAIIKSNNSVTVQSTKTEQVTGSERWQTHSVCLSNINVTQTTDFITSIQWTTILPVWHGWQVDKHSLRVLSNTHGSTQRSKKVMKLKQNKSKHH